MPPAVYILAGPNGVGKTTFAREFLSRYAGWDVFVNADLIAQELSPQAVERAAVAAGRLALARIEEFSRRRIDFAFESTLSGRGYIGLLQRLKEQGYSIQIFFLWVPSAEILISRVRSRVLRGGHNIDEPDLRRRYSRSARMFLRHYSGLADVWTLFDTSAGSPRVLARQRSGNFDILDPEAYESFVSQDATDSRRLG